MLFTSESVTQGHPDKICDQISDSILDSYLKDDPYSRVACETCVSKNLVLVSGEITSKAKVDIEKVVRKTIIDIGYDNDELGFNGNTIKIIVDISEQSSDIALGVDKSLEKKQNKLVNNLGAGDQGMMFGFASNETENYMPAAIYYAHELARRLEYVRKNKILKYLRPDGKTQVTVEYENDKVKRIDTIIVSSQHNPDIAINMIKDDIIKYVVNKVIPSKLIDSNTKILVNSTGRFVIGGPLSDTGLTGRKIIVDTYGGYARHGGGAFSGKDYTKVDRTAAYYARYVAKNIVANGLASKCEIGVAYAIGVANPVAIYINTFNTNKIPEEKIKEIITNNFDFKPSSIIKKFDMSHIKYSKYSIYGHFGCEDAPWENVEKLIY